MTHEGLSGASELGGRDRLFASRSASIAPGGERSAETVSTALALVRCAVVSGGADSRHASADGSPVSFGSRGGPGAGGCARSAASQSAGPAAWFTDEGEWLAHRLERLRVNPRNPPGRAGGVHPPRRCSGISRTRSYPSRSPAPTPLGQPAASCIHRDAPRPFGRLPSSRGRRRRREWAAHTGQLT